MGSLEVHQGAPCARPGDGREHVGATDVDRLPGRQETDGLERERFADWAMTARLVGCARQGAAQVPDLHESDR